MNLENIICSSDYSSILKLFRVTAFMLRFVNNLRNRSQQQERNVRPLNPPEILKAEHAWLQTVQQQFIVGDPKFKMLQKSLGLFHDENKMLSCKGRISNANLPCVTKFPAILPKDHHLTSLIIRQSHERVMHNGVKETLCLRKEKYWIAHRHQVVMRVIHMCNVCGKLEGKPYASPHPASLPDFRVSEQYLFSHTGVDFAGLIYVKTSVRKETEMTKSYIALYTCASTRAVHLELVPNLTADAFI